MFMDIDATHYDVNITLYICEEGSDVQITFSVMGYYDRHIFEDLQSYLGQLSPVLDIPVHTPRITNESRY